MLNIVLYGGSIWNSFNRLNELYKKEGLEKGRIMNVTIKDVAKLANVSTATVSNVVNNSKFVRIDTKNKVLDAMEKLDYRPSNIAKYLRGVKSNVIGLIVPSQEQDTSSEFFGIFAAGVEQVLQSFGYQMLTANTHEDYNKEKSRLELFNNGMFEYVEGIIIVPTSGLLKSIELENYSIDLPIVFADRKPNHMSRYDVVYTNNYSITLEILEHILSLGYKEIIFISGPLDVSSTIERREAFEKIHSKYHGGKRALIFETQSSFEAGYELGEEVVEATKNNKTAILFSNNTIAMGMIKYFKDKKINIPRDLGLVVYDDYSWMEITEPSLTAIKQPAFKMGMESAKLILDNLNNKNHIKRRIEIPSIITYRNSL